MRHFPQHPVEFDGISHCGSGEAPELISAEGGLFLRHGE